MPFPKRILVHSSDLSQPESLLESDGPVDLSTANFSRIIGTVKQLAILSSAAMEIFQNLGVLVEDVHDRTKELVSRTEQARKKLGEVDEALHVVHLQPDADVLHVTQKYLKKRQVAVPPLFIQPTNFPSIRAQYKLCTPPPQLWRLESLVGDDLAQFFSFPGFFFQEWLRAELFKQECLKAQRKANKAWKKQVKREKKRQLRELQQRNRNRPKSLILRNSETGSHQSYSQRVRASQLPVYHQAPPEESSPNAAGAQGEAEQDGGREQYDDVDHDAAEGEDALMPMESTAGPHTRRKGISSGITKVFGFLKAAEPQHRRGSSILSHDSSSSAAPAPLTTAVSMRAVSPPLPAPAAPTADATLPKRQSLVSSSPPAALTAAELRPTSVPLPMHTSAGVDDEDVGMRYRSLALAKRRQVQQQEVNKKYTNKFQARDRDRESFDGGSNLRSMRLAGVSPPPPPGAPPSTTAAAAAAAVEPAAEEVDPAANIPRRRASALFARPPLRGSGSGDKALTGLGGAAGAAGAAGGEEDWLAQMIAGVTTTAEAMDEDIAVAGTPRDKQRDTMRSQAVLPEVRRQSQRQSRRKPSDSEASRRSGSGSSAAGGGRGHSPRDRSGSQASSVSASSATSRSRRQLATPSSPSNRSSTQTQQLRRRESREEVMEVVPEAEDEDGLGEPEDDPEGDAGAEDDLDAIEADEEEGPVDDDDDEPEEVQPAARRAPPPPPPPAAARRSVGGAAAPPPPPRAPPPPAPKSALSSSVLDNIKLGGASLRKVDTASLLQQKTPDLRSNILNSIKAGKQLKKVDVQQDRQDKKMQNLNRQNEAIQRLLANRRDIAGSDSDESRDSGDSDSDFSFG